MKVTIKLTLKECAYIMTRLLIDHPFDPEFRPLREKSFKYKDPISLGKRFETQVIDQIQGTKFYEEYKQYRAGENVWIRGLPWRTSPVFPYTESGVE